MWKGNWKEAESRGELGEVKKKKKAKMEARRTVADEQMFTEAQISSVNIVTASRCGWISRRRGNTRMETDGSKDMLGGGGYLSLQNRMMMALKHERPRWEETHQLQQTHSRVQPGSKGRKTSISEERREATKMTVISGDNRPAALTLWPSSALLLTTQTKLLWAVSGDVSNAKRQTGARRLQEGLRIPSHYSVSVMTMAKG